MTREIYADQWNPGQGTLDLSLTTAVVLYKTDPRFTKEHLDEVTQRLGVDFIKTTASVPPGVYLVQCSAVPEHKIEEEIKAVSIKGVTCAQCAAPASMLFIRSVPARVLVPSPTDCEVCLKFYGPEYKGVCMCDAGPCEDLCQLPEIGSLWVNYSGEVLEVTDTANGVVRSGVLDNVNDHRMCSHDTWFELVRQGKVKPFVQDPIAKAIQELERELNQNKFKRPDRSLVDDGYALGVAFAIDVLNRLSKNH
jgi:hypothetical protein